MCAIYGLLDPELGKFERQEILRKMGSQLQHRGPDSNGYWIDNEEGVALGHRGRGATPRWSIFRRDRMAFSTSLT